ncbi:MAG: ABC transporter ATP-binding protein [Dehalococcoidia bacterium]
MTSSPEAATGARLPEGLPPAIPSMWRLVRLGYRNEPTLLLAAFLLSLLAALPDALFALWLKLLGQGVLESDRTLLFIAAAGLATSTAGTWFLAVISTRVQRRFRDRVTIALEAHVARLQASVSTIAHQERPDYLDRLAVLRDQVFVLDHLYMSLFTTAGWVLRLVVVLGLLVSIHPALILLGVCALPTVLVSTWRPAVERAAEEQGASAKRLARHYFGLATAAPPGKEVRVAGIGPRLATGRRDAWERWYAPVAAARWGSALWQGLAWALFGAGYTGSVIFVASGLDAPPADVLLLLAAGARLSAYIGATVGEIGFLRGIWMDGSQRLAWLEDYAAAVTRDEDLPAPEAVRTGISVEHLSFAYPGTDRLVLDDVTFEIPAGAVVAVVGENGAGKSTLVKLLCKLYEPASGSIAVDGVPLARIRADEWRERIAGAFQDFFRFEFRARHSVSVGDVPRFDSEGAVVTAVGRAGAEDVVAKLPAALETQLGPTWPGGVDVSFGQWQKIALARGFMRDAPLLLVLDEPTAALDAETEHALFERYAAAARQGTELAANGRITVLVSHRFSTVRMADLIVVLSGAKLAEFGTHEQLMAKGGAYAELYRIQAAAYR